MSSLFITGGAGYIGAPTVHAFVQSGFRVIVYDTVPPPENIKKQFIYVKGDIRKKNDLKSAMRTYRPDSVIHLAALKSAIDSEKQKKSYEETNVHGTKNVLAAMNVCGCKKIIFASSASVYGLVNKKLPEASPLHPMNIYAETKVKGETLIQADKNIHWIILRYSNVVGATDDGMFGESIQHNPKLIPSALRAGVSMRKYVMIYGNTYPTPDGTAIRDYVSLRDVVRANVMAVRYLQADNPSVLCNIGSGIGTSNMEVVHAVEKCCKKKIPMLFKKQRKEVSISVANIERAKNIFGWEPESSALSNIINTLIFFQKTLHQ